jgi:hypothetical protein
MRFTLITTRESILKHNIKYELASENPDIEKIMVHIKQYEQNNLDSIQKLKRERKVETNKINGALKSTIHAHGPITLQLIGSATKRIHGSLLTDPNTQKKSFLNRIIQNIKKWLS